MFLAYRLLLSFFLAFLFRLFSRLASLFSLLLLFLLSLRPSLFPFFFFFCLSFFASSPSSLFSLSFLLNNEKNPGESGDLSFRFVSSLLTSLFFVLHLFPSLLRWALPVVFAFCLFLYCSRPCRLLCSSLPPHYAFRLALCLDFLLSVPYSLVPLLSSPTLNEESIVVSPLNSGGWGRPLPHLLEIGLPPLALFLPPGIWCSYHSRLLILPTLSVKLILYTTSQTVLSCVPHLF